MTVDRELRSSKRQRIGSAGLDVPLVSSDSPEQVTQRKRKDVYPELEDAQMSDCKTHGHISSKDSAKGSENDGRKLYLEVSEENRKQTGGISKGNLSDATNGMSNASSLKTERQRGSNDISVELFPEHNEKLADTLLSLKGMNVSSPKFGPLPNAGENQWLDSDVSEAAIHCIDSETCKEKYVKVDEIHHLESELLHKLEKYIDANGGTIEDGWKVQATKRNKTIYKIYISPDSRRFRSMKEVARSLGLLVKKKGSTGVEEDSDKAEQKLENASGSTCLNTNVSQMQHMTGNLGVDQIPRKRANQELRTQISRKGKGSERQQQVSDSPVTEHYLKQAKALVEAEMQPSSGLSTMEMKNKTLPDSAKTLNGSGDMKEKQLRDWTEILEKVLKTSNMTAGGVRNQILKALASEPPEWAKQMLHLAINKDVSQTSGSVPMKEAVLSVLARYRGEEASHEQLERERFHEKPSGIQETGKAEEGMVENNYGNKNNAHKVLRSSEMVTKCCRNVFQDIISAEKFAVLCNLIHGNFVGSRTHDMFDFRLIDLRMNAGTYGMSPELFNSDMQQIWKRVREIGQEMVLVADSLSQHSEASYKKQVAGLLQGDAEEIPEIDHANLTAKANVNGGANNQEDLDEQPQEIIEHTHCSKHNSDMMHAQLSEEDYNPSCTTSKNPKIDQDDHNRKTAKDVDVSLSNDMPKNAHHSGKAIPITMKNMEGSINGSSECEQGGLPNIREVGSSGYQGECRSCGRNEHNDCIILCNTCEAAYHTYCLSPVLEEIPSSSWYCSSCPAAGKEPSEVHSFSDRKDSGIVNEERNNVVHNCLVAETLSGQMAAHSNGQNGEPYIDRTQVEFESESNRKEVGPSNDKEMTEMHSDRGKFDFHSDGVHDSRQVVELHDCEESVEKLCKVCSTGKKDDDDLIKCSNEICLYKFYHLRCLRPPLASVPPPTWYCPSCLCRSCFIDENDANIILCDGCDDCYHTYCLEPPLTEIPESNWYCPPCLEKQKRKKGKKGPNSVTSKSVGRVHSKKASRAASPSSLHLGSQAADLSERTVDPIGRVRSKKTSQAASTSSLRVRRGVHDFSERIIDHEMENSVQHLQSKKTSQSSSSPMEEEEEREATSDGSLDGVTENFIVRVRPKHTNKFLTTMESKEAGKRKRKCSEPRRSQV